MLKAVFAQAESEYQKAHLDYLRKHPRMPLTESVSGTLTVEELREALPASEREYDWCAAEVISALPEVQRDLQRSITDPRYSLNTADRFFSEIEHIEERLQSTLDEEREALKVEADLPQPFLTAVSEIKSAAQTYTKACTDLAKTAVLVRLAQKARRAAAASAGSTTDIAGFDKVETDEQGTIDGSGN